MELSLSLFLSLPISEVSTSPLSPLASSPLLSSPFPFQPFCQIASAQEVQATFILLSLPSIILQLTVPLAQLVLSQVLVREQELPEPFLAPLQLISIPSLVPFTQVQPSWVLELQAPPSSTQHLSQQAYQHVAFLTWVSLWKVPISFIFKKVLSF